MNKIILKIKLFALLAYDKIRDLYKADKLNMAKTIKIPFFNRRITMILGWLEKDYWSLFNFDLLDEDVHGRITIINFKSLKLRLHIMIVRYKGRQK